MSFPHIKQAYDQLRASFDTQKTHSREWRETQLKGLKRMMENETSRIYQVLKEDLGRCTTEAFEGDIGGTIAELNETLANFSSWMKPTSVATPMLNMKGISATTIQPTPLGVVLVIGAWNYPINLCVVPMLGAIAAGNCVLLKPSEISASTSKFLAEVIPKYVDADCIKVIEGGPAETTEILKLTFDHIFYTGNSVVGRIIMKAAAEHLTPVTLELGGKSPVFIDLDHANIQVAARRIMWGKTFNCGQTCIAPDYVMVPKHQEQRLIEALQTELDVFFKGGNIKDNSDFGRIVSKRHMDRITSYFDDVNPEDIIVGGPKEADSSTRYFPPTIVKSVKTTQKLMQEEIFGPILPIVPVEDVKEAIKFVRSRPHPLALYIFSNSHEYKSQIINSTQSGAVVVNDVMMHFAQSTIPFGGVGESGMGSYHGKRSFDLFSHMRPVLDKSFHLDSLNSMRYAPYSDSKLNMMKWFM